MTISITACSEPCTIQMVEPVVTYEVWPSLTCSNPAQPRITLRWRIEQLMWSSVAWWSVVMVGDVTTCNTHQELLNSKFCIIVKGITHLYIYIYCAWSDSSSPGLNVGCTPCTAYGFKYKYFHAYRPPDVITNRNQRTLNKNCPLMTYLYLNSNNFICSSIQM